MSELIVLLLCKYIMCGVGLVTSDRNVTDEEKKSQRKNRPVDGLLILSTTGKAPLSICDVIIT